MHMRHLKELLVAKGKTQSELASVLGRDKSAITNLLQGKRQLKAAEVPLIATFLGVSEAEVLGSAQVGMAEPARIPFRGAPSAAVLATGQVIEQEGRYFFEETDAQSERYYALEVSDRSLDLHGLLPGDIVICDPTIKAAADDVVVVQIYHEDGSADSVLRHYRPPFLDAHSTREGFARLHEERANVAILAPVKKMIRFYS